MSEPLAWRFFFWITPRWLSGRVQTYGVRCFIERYPGVAERQMRAALAQPIAAMTQRFGGIGPSEEELAARSKHGLDVMLHPEAHKRRFSQIGPHP